MFTNIFRSLCLVTAFCCSIFGITNYPFPQQNTYQYGFLPKGISYKHVQTIYDVWLPNFYEEQGNLARIKFDNPQQTVSEGIGYGMLILVYMDNEENSTKGKFDKLWNYFKQYPSNGLMHWKINGFGGVAESGSATDGDIDVALALIMAAKQWGDDTYLTGDRGANAIISAIRQNDVSGNLLDGGDQWNAINPSYMSMVATQLFQEIEPSGGWADIQSSCYGHLKSSQNGNTGMWPNWTSGGVGGCPGCYGFDAARTPWRLGWAYVWYGHADAKTCCTKIVNWFKSSTNNQPGSIGQIYNLDGSINTGAGGSNDNIPTYLGPLVVAGMVDSSAFRTWVDNGYTRLTTFGASNDNYYNECLELLTMLLLTGNMPDFTKVQPKTTAKLTIKITPGDSAGTVSVTPQKSSYSRGETVTVTAASKDAAKYSFVGWQGDYEGTSATISLQLKCDMSITALFKDNLAMDLVDDCEDNNARTFLKTPWFTFTDVNSNGNSTVTPTTDEGKAFKMTAGGCGESEYAAKIEYNLDKGSFSGDPFVGMGFQFKANGDSVDISECTGISFYYKGSFSDDTSCAVKLESASISGGGESYRHFLKSSDQWKQVVLLWEDFTQPKWVKNPASLDLTTAKKIQWQIQSSSGSGELWLDDIHLTGLYIERPIKTTFPPSVKNNRVTPRLVISGSGSNMSIHYHNEKTGIVRIGLFSLNGKLVSEIVNSIQPAGNQSVMLGSACAVLSNGGYVLRYRDVTGLSTTRPFLINR